MRIGVLALFLMAAPGLWLDVPAAHAQVPLKLVRVAILKDINDFNLSIKGKFTVAEMPGAAVLSEGNILWDARVSALGDKIQFGKQSFSVRRLKITPHKDATIYVNNRRFRGVIDVVRNAKGFLTVINSIELESYIKGVMYHEVSHYWPMESLKAQAVVARTYALYQMKANAAKDFDLTNDIYSQVYGGKGSERYRTNIAVDRTKGLILTFRDKILYAYYHATCAGHTEDVSELWEQDLPPLKGVPCDFCRYSPHALWKKNFRLANIQEKLSAKGFKIGLIQGMAVIERNPSGRIRTLEITMRDDKKVRISGKEFREIIGPNTIKSNNYEIVMQGYYMDLIGKGWGHGVGMCQWGASEMAREGYSYDQILQFYYPGVTIVDYASLQN